MDKKNILTYQGLKKLEDELQELKVVRRKEDVYKRQEFVIIITIRSIPNPIPPVGGIPIARAFKKS